jgi:endo-1,4-beta-xylanase
MKTAGLFLFALYGAFLASGQTLGSAGAERALLIGTAADADEFGMPNRLLEPPYGSTLGTQYTMLEPENAMKWNPIHPAQTTYNFEPGDKLVAYAAAHGLKTRGHNLCWEVYNPDWLTTLAATATPAQMSAILQDHITTVVSHYKGQVFAWDVVNEAISDSASGTGTDLKDGIWYDQPGIGLPGTGFVEQALRWARAADPNALLFYNEYSIEGPGPKFQAMYNMVKDFVSRGVPIDGVGFQMHIDTTGYPDTAGLTQNIQQITALGLQVHITEMDVRVPVDANGNASSADLQAQAQTYQRILTVCLQNPGCTAFQTWGFTDKYSWIPAAIPGYGASLPFDANYQPKPAYNSILNTLQTVPPRLNGSAIVNAASYHGSAVAPGELVTIFQSDFGPAALVGAQLDSQGRVSSNLAGTQVLFDGVPAPIVYALAGQSSVIVPYEVAGKQQTMVQYVFNGVASNTVGLPVAPAAPAIFAADATGAGPGLILNQDNTLNTAKNPAAGGSVIQILATGGGAVAGGAVDGSLASGLGKQMLPVTATVAGKAATVTYAGPAPGEVNGVMQVNLILPAGLGSGPQPVIVMVNGVASQNGITVAMQ